MALYKAGRALRLVKTSGIRIDFLSLVWLLSAVRDPPDIIYVGEVYEDFKVGSSFYGVGVTVGHWGLF